MTTILEVRSQGNKAFLDKKYHQALDLYHSALLLAKSPEDDKEKAVILSNCSACYLKLNKANDALKAANDAISLDKLYTKAVYRKSLALQALDNPVEALRIYQEHLTLLEAEVAKIDSIPVQNEVHGEKLSRPYDVEYVRSGRKMPQGRDLTQAEKDIVFVENEIAQLQGKLKSLNSIQKLKLYLEETKKKYGRETIMGISQDIKPQYSMFEQLKLVGEGNYSLIWKVKFIPTGEIFALKVIDKNKAEKTARRHENLFNEIKLEKFALVDRFLKTQQEKGVVNGYGEHAHPNIIHFIQTFQDTSNICFLYEFCNQGEVWDRMRYKNRFNKEPGVEMNMIGLEPSLTKFYIAQLLSALEFLKENNFVHRDIKPENMLITSNNLCLPRDNQNGVFSDEALIKSGKSNRIQFLRVIDFGTGYDVLQEAESNSKTHFIGTPDYMSFEAIKAKVPTFALDVWHFGCVLYQLFVGKIPFKGGSPFLCYLRSKALQYELPDSLPINVSNLIKRIFLRNATLRPTIEEVKADKYFEDVDFEKLKSRPLRPFPPLVELCVTRFTQFLSNIKYKKVKNGSYLLRKFSKLGHRFALNASHASGELCSSAMGEYDKKFYIEFNGALVSLSIKSQFPEVMPHLVDSLRNMSMKFRCNKNYLLTGFAKACGYFEDPVTDQLDQDADISVNSAVDISLWIKRNLEQRGILKYDPVASLFIPKSKGSSVAYKFRRAEASQYIGFNRHNQLKFKGGFNMLYIPDLSHIATSSYESILRTLVEKINSFKEHRPHMIILNDGFVDSKIGDDIDAWKDRVDKYQALLGNLQNIYPIVICPSDLGSEAKQDHIDILISRTKTYEQVYGSSYYSLFLQGCKLIVINSCLLQHVPAEFSEFWTSKTTKKKLREKPRRRKPKKKNNSQTAAKEESEEPKEVGSDESDVGSDFSELETEESEQEANQGELESEDEKVERESNDSDLETEDALPESSLKSWVEFYDFEKYPEIAKAAIDHFIWLEHELLSAKFEARHSFIFSYHSWHGKDVSFEKGHVSGDQALLMPSHLIDFFLPRFKRGNGQAIFTSNNPGNIFANCIHKEPPSGMFDTKLQHIYTSSFIHDGSEKLRPIDCGSIRVLKVMSNDTKSEIYKLESMPKYLVMPDDHYVEEASEKSDVSDISSSTFGSSDMDEDYHSE